ncbi:MAG: hypothetical protein EOM25_09115 [Deltaproteobacteria bacterium]|nr:hypothetical protein [Deltaproteobacteria bacterium]
MSASQPPSAPDTNALPGWLSRFFFDRRDHELLGIVNDVLEQKNRSRGDFKRLLAPHLHPHGIKEMAAPRGLRIAYAVLKLLESLEVGQAEDRLKALTALRDEVVTAGGTDLPLNTARALLQIMKELVRAKDDRLLQLRLARDFRTTALGRPRLVRRQLKNYHLLEMPEEWNQVVFDDHVHDANTKGRKSATHLVMDAWIKGIRELTVVYYNHVQPEAASELLEAGAVMDIKVSIGIELSARFWDRYVRLIWTPNAARNTQTFLNFLADPDMAEFTAECVRVEEYRERYVFDVIDAFNIDHLPTVNDHFGVDLPRLSRDDFKAYVGAGRPSLLHLARFIHDALMKEFRLRLEKLRPQFAKSDPNRRTEIQGLVREMNLLDSGEIIRRWLSSEQNPGLRNPFRPPGPDEENHAPDLLHLGPKELASRLRKLHSSFELTLVMDNICTQDALEILYDCEGFITHLEIFNLKTYVSGNQSCPNDWSEANELQRALNTGNVTVLKRILQDILTSFDYPPLNETIPWDRKVKFVEILFDLDGFRNIYRHRKLGTRLGSSSTGQSRHLYGMGLAVLETLPRPVQRRLDRDSERILPIRAETMIKSTARAKHSPDILVNWIQKKLRRIPLLEHFGYTHHKTWEPGQFIMDPEIGANLVAIGGISKAPDNGLSIRPKSAGSQRTRLHPRYLNSGLKNALKVMLGFAPAFATFALTKDWWLLAYFGAVIWFAITGLRNIIQSVLGGGGLRRSPLLRWNSYVSWERLTDSLLYTGFSVPLLDYVVKTVFLDQNMGVTTSTSPVILYTVMALANGIYITTHNIFRGLPRSAAFGNFFRSLLSIPLALAFNAVTGGLLVMAGLSAVDSILQKWAAIISKLASDCVAGIIEGYADRLKNMAQREIDYHAKLRGLFDAYTTLELLFPETSVLAMVESPQQLMCILNTEEQGLEKIIIIHSLDLLYFWMYQPRARSVLKKILKTMAEEDRQVFIRSQGILMRHRDISQMFVDGIVGKNFSKALSFYLDRSAEYLDAMQKLGVKYQSPWSTHQWRGYRESS